MSKLQQRISEVHLVDPPGIIGNVLLVLRVDSIDLPVSGRLGKEGGEEELREPVQGPAQVIRADIEVVVGVVARGEGIEAAPVLAQVLAVFILVRELLCAWLRCAITSLESHLDQPKKSMCSQKCARPGRLDGSLM